MNTNSLCTVFNVKEVEVGTPRCCLTYTQTRIGEYLCRARYMAVDEGRIRRHLETKAIPSMGGCSAVWKGRFIGRNLDWLYNRQNDVETHCFGIGGYAYAGVASMANIDWDLLPGYTQDGVNHYGVYCNINVVPDDYGNTVESVPLIEMRDKICTLMVPYYVLRNFRTARSAAEYIRDYVALFSPNALKEMHYESHYMIADINECFILEIVDGTVVLTEHPIMTNFFIHGVTFNPDGKVWTMESGHSPVSENGITPYGSGLERYNYIIDNMPNNPDKESMLNLMSGLRYTNAYRTDTNPQWYSEFVGHYQQNVTLDTPIDDEYFQHVLAVARANYEAQDRDAANFWQTTHCCVYDLLLKRFWIVSQEDFENIIPVSISESDPVCKTNRCYER